MRTDEGKQNYLGNCHVFSWADLENVPNEICKKHGFELIESCGADEIVHLDELLVDESELFGRIKRIIVSDIKWDAPKSANLPSEVVIEICATNKYLLDDFIYYADELSNFLSDTYGYCHEGFSARIVTEEGV